VDEGETTGNSQGNDDYPFWREEDFENIEEKTVQERLAPLVKYFFDQLVQNHQIINLMRESARMFPKHAKFNVLMVALIQLSFMSCLF